jgi:hypothetical protein
LENRKEENNQILLSINENDSAVYSSNLNPNVDFNQRYPSQQEVLESKNLPYYNDTLNTDLNPPCPIIQPSNYVNNSCPHRHIDLEYEISSCETCVCYACCFLGFLALFVALVAACKQDESSHNHSNAGEIFLWSNHWLYNYGYSRDFIESRMDSHKNYSELDSGCFGLKYPHNYKIKCTDCNFILKKGHDSGGLTTALIFGFCGVFIAILCVVYLLKE